MLNEEDNQKAPPIWYKQFWPWFIIFFPALAVVAGIITIRIANESADGLVIEDYYKKGLAINQNLERTEKAETLNLSAFARVNETGTQVQLQMLDGSLEKPSDARIHLLHATIPKLDQIVESPLSDSGFYTVQLSEESALRAGRWHIQLENLASDWRITGSLTFPKERSVKLIP